MAGVRTLATAFVELRPDNRRLGVEIRSQTESAGDTAGQNSGRHFGEAFKRAVKAASLALAVGAAFVGVKALSFLKQANADASDLNETVSKAENIYPKTQAALQRFAATSASALGLSKQQALEGAASFGNFFNQIGIGEQKSLKMSTALIQLSADLGSFSNADPSQVMDAFLSATRGEYDALQRFIPTINAATVQAEAMRMTHKRSTKDLTDADKALALYNLSLKGAGKGAGDFARTAEGQANALRTWKANLADIRAEIGTAFMPVVTQVVNLLNSKFVPLVKSLWAEHGPQVTRFFQQAVVGISAMMSAFQEGDVTSDGFVGKMERIGVALRNIGPWIKQVIGYVKEWAAANGETGGQTFSERLSDAGDSLKQLLPLVKEFIAELPSLNDLVSVAGTVLKFLADHTDELRDAMPLLVAAVVAYKVAQLASNIAVAASPVFKIADTIATRQQTAALRAQTAALTASKVATAATTVATASETVVQNVSMATRLRATAALVAQKAIMLAVRAATIAWTAVQWLLNVALTANPIGLVIAAIALLVAGIIYAYKHSETFRNIVQGAWHGIQVAAKATVNWFVNVAWPFLKRVWEKISSDVSRAVGLIKDHFTTLVDFVRSIPGRITGFFSNLGSSLYQKGKDLITGFINGIKEMAGKVADALVGLLPGPLKKFAGTLGLASPSKLFAQYGRDTVRGYVIGLQDEAGSIDVAMGQLFRPRTGGVGGFAPTATPPAAVGGSSSVTINTLAQDPVVLAKIVTREQAWATGV